MSFKIAYPEIFGVTESSVSLAFDVVDDDALMRFGGQLTESISYQIAGREGYDIAALKKLAASAEIEARIGDNYALARTLGLKGTPIVPSVLPSLDLSGPGRSRFVRSGPS